MAVHPNPLLRYIHSLAPLPESAADGELLGRFVHQRDQDAFTELVRRHGPMVLGVCRRVLDGTAEAEDAFQAVFLVLARKAAALRRPERLAAWLHGVARHLALKCRRAKARRRCHEAAGHTSATATDPLEELTARELLTALDEELARLPERYRLPLILCHLEGHTYEEAARLLGWTAGSVKGRLQRGRKQLHARLSRRGLALGAIVLAMESMAATTVSAALRQATMQSARTFAGGSAEGIAASVLALAEAGITSVTVTKAKVGLVLLLALGLAGGTGALALPLWSEKQAEKNQADATTPIPESETPNPASDKHALTDAYGDPLPPGAVARMGTIRFRHIGTVISVAYSPDSKIIASGQRNEGPIVLWDAASGKELRRLEEQPGVLGAFAFSPDGKQLALAKSGSWIGLWDVVTGKQVRRLKARSGGAGVCVAFSADGKTLANSYGNDVVLFDVSKGAERLRLKGHPETVASLAFSPDGNTVAAGGQSKTIVLWHAAKGKILHQLVGHEKEIPCVAFSADGKTLASASHDCTARLWDVATGQEQRRFVHQHKYNDDAIQTVHFVPGRPQLITGGSRSIRVWDLPTGKQIRSLPGHSCLCDCPTALSPDGAKLATREQGQIVLWELATGKRLFTPEGHQGFVASVVFSPDGKTLATGSGDKTLRLWDAGSGKELRRFTLAYNMKVAFVADGKLLVAGSDGFIRVWDAATFKELRRFPTHKDGLNRVVFAADGKTCFSSGVNRQEWSADGKTLISKPSDTLIRRWRIDTGEEIGQFKGLSKAANALALAPDGSTLVSAMSDGTPVRLWDVASGKEIRQFRGHKDWLACVAFSPDGKTIAAGGRGKVIHLWDAATGEEVRPLTGHEDYTGWGENCIHAVRFSPDGRMLASAASDRTIRLWEIATGQERRRFLGHRQPAWTLDFSRDGRRLASAGMDSTVLIWDVMGRVAAEREGAVRLSENELTRLWNELGDEKNAALAHQAIRTLLRDPVGTMRWFRKQLHPVPVIDQAKIAQRIADLDSAEFAVREKAVSELERQGEAVEGALRKVLEGRLSLEVRQRVKLLLEKLTGASRLRSLRAVEVLEHLDTVDSHRFLETLAGGASDARLTQDAKASLRRLRLATLRRSVREPSDASAKRR